MSKAARTTPRQPAETRQRLLDATRGLMLQRGFTATGVDDICREAGVTKGAFFHHFKSKEDLGRAALSEWAVFGMGLYAAARAESPRYPLDHLHRFFEIMIGFVETNPGQVTCLVGMLSQEMSQANSALREACSSHLTEWAEFAKALLVEAKAAQPPRIDFDPAEIAWLLESVWQGSMLIGKTRLEPPMIIQNLRHARAYVDSLFSGTITPVEPRSSSATHANN